MTQSDKLVLVASGIAKGAIVKAAQQAGGGRVEVLSMSDIQAAQAVKAGQANYFIGSCATGQGGALTMAIALLGPTRCVMLTNRGRMMEAGDIQERVRMDYLAYGISADHAPEVIPLLVQALLEKHQLDGA